jgi:hypothetical protein
VQWKVRGERGGSEQAPEGNGSVNRRIRALFRLELRVQARFCHCSGRSEETAEGPSKLSREWKDPSTVSRGTVSLTGGPGKVLLLKVQWKVRARWPVQWRVRASSRVQWKDPSVISSGIAGPGKVLLNIKSAVEGPSTVSSAMEGPTKLSSAMKWTCQRVRF